MIDLVLVYGFMLVPIWIPLFTVSVGVVADAVRRDS